MIVVSTEVVAGYEVAEVLGLVQGSTVRTKHVGKDFFAGIKTIFGGELKGYTELLNEARQQATERMTVQASELGADAIVSVRFTTSAVMDGASELFVYGTAVRLMAARGV